MTYFPDVNVWIALASDAHVHHAVATAWFESVGGDTVAFCRITELGFLRLLTNRHVMRDDVVSSAGAWQIYDEVRRDARVVFLAETTGFSGHWREIGDQILDGPNAWTDAYLAAFAGHMGATLVTFDRKIPCFGGVLIKSIA